jgi:hypothetical protein
VSAEDVVVKAKVDAGMDMKDAQELWLEVQLRAFVGSHPSGCISQDELSNMLARIQKER